MNIDFVVRDNSESKGGGDLHQIETYMRLLEQRGWRVRMVPFSPAMDLGVDAIVHVVNVDRPFDALSAIRQAGSRPVFVSSIHHSLPAVRRMRQSESGFGMRSTIGRVLPENLREYASFVVRCQLNATSWSKKALAAWEGLRALPQAPAVWAALGQALDRVNAVFLLAENERSALQNDTGWKGRNGQLAPNGAPGESAHPHVWETRSDAILVVGRVEPRKRQLELVRAAAGRKLGVEVVGELQQPESEFAEAFRRAVDAAPNVNWRGPLTHEATVALMGASKVLVNPSWVEVQSLVELEAALAGAWVVGSAAAGSSGEWLPEVYRGVPNDDVRRMLDQAQGLIDAGAPPSDPAYPWTWEMAVDVLDAAYKDVI